MFGFIAPERYFCTAISCRKDVRFQSVEIGPARPTTSASGRALLDPEMMRRIGSSPSATTQARMSDIDAHMRPERSFQGLILTLQRYWADHGCVILQPYDMEMGAGTFHPATTLRGLVPKSWKAAYVQPARRPKGGRDGENPIRLQH